MKRSRLHIPWFVMIAIWIWMVMSALLVANRAWGDLWNVPAVGSLVLFAIWAWNR